MREQTFLVARDWKSVQDHDGQSGVADVHMTQNSISPKGAMLLELAVSPTHLPTHGQRLSAQGGKRGKISRAKQLKWCRCERTSVLVCDDPTTHASFSIVPVQ